MGSNPTLSAINFLVFQTRRKVAGSVALWVPVDIARGLLDHHGVGFGGVRRPGGIDPQHGEGASPSLPCGTAGARECAASRRAC